MQVFLQILLFYQPQGELHRLVHNNKESQTNLIKTIAQMLFLFYSIFLSEQNQPNSMIWEVSKSCLKKTIRRTQKLSLFILQHYKKHKQNIRTAQKLPLFILLHIVKWTNITNKHMQSIRRTQKLSLFILQHIVKRTNITNTHK